MKHIEKHIEESLRHSLQDIEVPKRLEPDTVLKVLQVQEPAKGTRSRSAAPRRSRRAVLVAAACLALAAGIGVLAFIQGNGEWGKDALPSVEEWQSTMAERVVDGSLAPTAQSYQEALACLREAYRRNGTVGSVGSDAASDTAIADGAIQGSGADSSQPVSDTHSSTNIRTENIEEADIVKTDGRYLYIVKAESHAVAVVDTSGGNMAQAGVIDLDGQRTIYELHLDSNRLYVLGTESDRGDTDVEEISAGSLEGPIGHSTTFAITYDIADPSNPVFLGEVKQTGQYQSSRLVGGNLYLFSRYAVSKNPKETTPEAYVPWVGGHPIACSGIYLPCTAAANQYYVISSISAEEPDRITDSKAVLCNWADLYVGSDTIYIYGTSCDIEDPDASLLTTIHALSYDNGHIESIVQTRVAGYLNDSFSIDEHEGYVRLVLTTDDQEGTRNRVLVLNNRLETVGAIENLAPGETVYSARLLGDTGYFVTYRQVDPLFTVDLSDPSSPRIVGKLKVPGFSEYLHFYGQDRLLGIGQGEDGIKLSMFDVSNPSNIIHLSSYCVPNAWQADAASDYKTVLIEPDRNLIAFSASSDPPTYEEAAPNAASTPDDWSGKSYYVLSYEEGEGFAQHMDEYVRGDSWMGVRGVRINETLYVICGDTIESYSLETFERTGEIDLFKNGE